MSDAALRAFERDELAANPADLDLRRQHARLLQRAGESEAAVGALDLAWRLGAEELWDELQAELAARALVVGRLELRYIPGGPFVMGAAGFDRDASPPHLVVLSPYYISAEQVSPAALHGWEGLSPWVNSLDPDSSPWLSNSLHETHWSGACAAADFLTRERQPPGLQGTYLLPSEAEWERAMRAGLLRPDGVNPYGLRPGRRVEWTRDRYHPDYYQSSPRFDPPGPPSGKEYVVRGIPDLPAPEFTFYREAADDAGEFRLGGGVFERKLPGRQGPPALRVVFRCR